MDGHQLSRALRKRFFLRVSHRPTKPFRVGEMVPDLHVKDKALYGLVR